MGAKIQLSEVSALEVFCAGNEVVLVHQNDGCADYVVHGTVRGIDAKNQFLELEGSLKLDIKEMQLIGARTKYGVMPAVDFNDPAAMLEYFKGLSAERKENDTYIFRSFARWKAYKVEQYIPNASPGSETRVSAQ